MDDMICLECWRGFPADPFHMDCTGEHFVPKADADRLREWLNGRRRFMMQTGQRAA